MNADHGPSTRRLLFSILLGLTTMVGPAAASDNLLVLEETGQTQDSLPILRISPRSAAVIQALSQGFSGKLLHLYSLEQEYLRRQEGREPQPAVLLLSHREGGFPCRGFVLDGRVRRQDDYVDLHEKSPLCGSFGAMDQIFPHELAHVMVRELVGDQASMGSNQVHAIGVTTDAETAFDEGFAEHMQILAVDDPQADPQTRALLADRREANWTERALGQYRRELAARAAWFSPRRAGFLLWFSRAEQAERYYDVTGNRFARAPALPARLLRSRDPYAAYLLENILPGAPDDPPKSIPRMLCTEGVVSSFFHRWATSVDLRRSYGSDSLYRRFGVAKGEVSEEENVYLKLLHAFHLTRPHTTREAIAGYLSVFPAERGAVDALIRQTFRGDLPPDAGEIWLSDSGFSIGSSLYDQFRSAPQPHLFDLNTAGAADLASVRGLTPALAAAIMRGQPWRSLDEVGRMAGFSAELAARFREMAAQAKIVQARAGSRLEVEKGLPIGLILRSYLFRALWGLGLATVGGAFASRLLRRRGWGLPLLNGLGAACLGLSAAWTSNSSPGAMALLSVVIVFGLPSLAWTAMRTRSREKALRSLLVWIVAVVPAAILVTPWF